MADYRELQPGQLTRVHIAHLDGRVETLWQTDERLLEAPNWLPDGTALLLNGDGVMWRLPLDGSEPEAIAIDQVPAVNNDHVLDPDGEHVFLSAMDFNLYRAPITGGTAELVTHAPDRDGLLHFLHGVSPDGSTLAFIGIEPDGENTWATANVFTVRADGTGYRQLTTGTAATDGSEFSPDGEWVYFNTEAFDGHAQIARMRPDGTHVEQLTFDEFVNWFPHPSPDAAHFTYLSFPPGTADHPADLWVDVKLVDGDDWSGARTVSRLFGGQGTTNVNGWAPTSDRFAFVSYPVLGQE